MFQGSIVALVTPMHSEGAVDFQRLQDLLDWHIQKKTDALVILGTTGESATLNTAEQCEIIKVVLTQVRGRLPVIVGTGTHCTQTSLERTRLAKELGADACLLVTPYYNRPTQEGLYQHYYRIAHQVAIPQILYNIPKRTGCDLMPDTVMRLANLPNIIGIKEGQRDRAEEIIQRCGKHFSVFSGDDDTALAIMRIGGKGVISVAANVIPDRMKKLSDLILQGNFSAAEKLDQQLKPVYQQLMIETNPIPVKWILSQLGLIASGIRLPLTELSQEHHEKMRTTVLSLTSIGEVPKRS